MKKYNSKIKIAVVFLIIFFGVLFFARASLAATYYVATNGNDANPGTLSAPWRTLQKAANTVSAGDTVYVNPGTYGSVSSSRSGTASARIRYVSSAKWGAKIDGGSARFVWYNEGNYVDIDGFEVTSSGNAQIGIYNVGSYVRLLNNHVHHIPASGYGSNGGAGIDSAAGGYYGSNADMIGNLVHDIGNLAGTSWLVHGLYQAQKGGVVQNNIVYRVEACGIHLWHAATDITISNNLVFKTNSCGIIVGAGDSPGGVTADNMIVSNNIVIDGGQYGIIESGRTGANNRYLNNLVYNSGTNWRLSTGSQSSSINADPKLVNYKPDGTGDYHLAEGSPAIDKGVSTGAPSTDLGGISRPQGAGYDIGAYEYVSGHLPLKGDVNQDGSVDILDVQACVNHILGIQTYGTRADINQDGVVNVLDVQAIVNIILGV